MKPQLSKALVQLREQFDDCYPERDRSSDGWLGDSRHSVRKSHHNPDNKGWVRALDIDADLRAGKDEMHQVVEQIRLLGRKRLSYIIFDGKIASAKSLWKWVAYKGVNPHRTHAHFSAKKNQDENRDFWNVPLLGGSNG